MYEIDSIIWIHSLLFCWYVWFVTLVSALSSTTVSPEEQFALEDLYNSTNGPNWITNRNWLMPNNSPCKWFGVTCKCNGNRLIIVWINFIQANANLATTFLKKSESICHVTKLDLHFNHLQGTLPSSLQYLAWLESLNLGLNQISGTIPSELGLIGPSLTSLILSRNELSGTIPWMSQISPSSNISSVSFQSPSFSASHVVHFPYASDSSSSCELSCSYSLFNDVVYSPSAFSSLQDQSFLHDSFELANSTGLSLTWEYYDYPTTTWLAPFPKPFFVCHS